VIRHEAIRINVKETNRALLAKHTQQPINKLRILKELPASFRANRKKVCGSPLIGTRPKPIPFPPKLSHNHPL
jgi:hypothetical protein